MDFHQSSFYLLPYLLTPNSRYILAFPQLFEGFIGFLIFSLQVLFIYLLSSFKLLSSFPLLCGFYLCKNMHLLWFWDLKNVYVKSAFFALNYKYTPLVILYYRP